ncbi:hypothetical protein pdam_00017453 [Pocillopora damicornis]|uniref:Uncharacterized protein n=1 Tax=Pocillopora damicornis TaxID=46731 RepID=A0A3M6U7P8_POCDA|nr:hypothetical protein pdam_00017453 [Pocillopora damicornis]
MDSAICPFDQLGPAKLFVLEDMVLYYTTANLEPLTLSTRVFRNAMFDSTLPWQMIDSAAGRLSVVRWKEVVQWYLRKCQGKSIENMDTDVKL